MENTPKQVLTRDGQIIRASIVGIVANVLLSAAKGVIGLLSGSIAILLDAVNNLTDAVSAVITLVGTKLAAKPADKKHPYGYGRYEYLTTIAVAFVIMIAGFKSFSESFKQLMEPTPTEYDWVSIAVLVLAIVSKILLSLFYKKAGEKTDSEALKDTGVDARLDAIVTTATLLAAIAYMIFGDAVICLDGILGLLISIVIIRAGVEMVMSPLNGLLGEREDHEHIEKIKADIAKHEGVLGVYDLILHDYGPHIHLGDVHIGVYDNMTAHEIHDLSRRIQRDIIAKYRIFFTIGIYAEPSDNSATKTMYDDIKAILYAFPGVLQVHGLYIDTKDKTISYDTVVEFGDKDYAQIYRELVAIVKNAYPDYTIDCFIDMDYSTSE